MTKGGHSVERRERERVGGKKGSVAVSDAAVYKTEGNETIDWEKTRKTRASLDPSRRPLAVLFPLNFTAKTTDISAQPTIYVKYLYLGIHGRSSEWVAVTY